MPNIQVADTIARTVFRLRQKQSTDCVWIYTIGCIVLSIMCMILSNEIVYYNNLAKQACNLTCEYDGLAEDICIFHNGTVVNTTTQRLDNILVVKQHTGEILFNQSLACSVNALLPYFETYRNYCDELNKFILKDSNNPRENKDSYAADVVIRWLFPNATNTISRVIKCKINPDLLASDYINIGYMQHLCETSKVSKRFCIVMYAIIYICYVALCMNHYVEIVNYIPPIDKPLPKDAICVITYEPIGPKQIYYKCSRCVAVYDYASIMHNWLYYSKNCPYCSMPIRQLTKYRNVQYNSFT